MGHMGVGHHVGKITATALGNTNSGKPYLAISMVNADSEFATAYLYFSQNALKWTNKQLLACGFEGKNVADLHDSQVLVGNKVEFDVAEEEYDGKTSLRVGMLFPEGGSGAVSNKMTKEEAQAFGATLIGRIGGASGDPDTPDLGDIPF